MSAVYDKNFLLVTKNPTDGLRRLETAHKLLAATEQEDDGTVPPGLDNLASALVTPNMLHSKSGEAQLLVCCCLVDVLRLYAPDAPYDDHQKLVSGFWDAYCLKLLLWFLFPPSHIIHPTHFFLTFILLHLLHPFCLPPVPVTPPFF